MQELSLNVLDIVQNSISAKAALIEIEISSDTKNKTMSIFIRDNGCGMTQEKVKQVLDPFYTTRTTRKVGLGIPFFKMTATMTGGDFKLSSQPAVGTTLFASYKTDHIDMLPLGDMAATMLSLISVNPDIDFLYTYKVNDNGFTMDTRQVKTILEGLPVNSPEVLAFIKTFIEENQEEINSNNKVVQDL